jgi:hypothetical protein
MFYFKKMILQTLLLTGIVFSTKLAAQSLAINNDGTTADVSAILDIKSSSKGLLVPRVSSTASITSPATGLLVYVTTGTTGFYYNTGTSAAPAWKILLPADGNATSLTNIPAANITGTLPSISGINLTNLNASNVASGTLAAGRMPALSGDITTTVGSVATTIANNAVTTNKIADANVTVAKISATGTASASTFLRGDGSWSAASGGGSSISNFVVTSASTYTLTSSNQVIVTNNTNLTMFTLPTAAAAGVGKIFYIVGSNNTSYGSAKVQIASGSGDLIYQGYQPPSTTAPVGFQAGGLIIISDGVSKWYLVSAT